MLGGQVNKLAQGYKHGHEDLDTKSSLVNVGGFVGPVHSTDEGHVTDHGHYGKGYENEDTRDHFGANFEIIEGSSLQGAVKIDRAFLDAPRYKAGQEARHALDHFAKDAGELVPCEGATTDHNMTYGQSYTKEHENKDTFSHFGNDMVPRKGADQPVRSYADKVAAHKARGRPVPQQFKVTFPGNVRVSYTENYGEKATRSMNNGAMTHGMPYNAGTFPADHRYVRYQGTNAPAERKMIFPGYAPQKQDVSSSSC